MSVWEYKVISSGKGGFATPALLEKFLGDLGRDEWEIIHYQSPPDNSLAFSGLARRPTQRDWTLQDAAAAAAKAEAEKLRAEFEAKFKAVTSGAAAPAATPEEKAAEFLAEEKLGSDDGLRRIRDTTRDDDPDAPDDEKDDWDKLTAAEEDELPVFFDAIKPHLRRNQRGPGMSVGADYLAKKWDQTEEDIKGALAECGFVLPADEDAKPEYLEYDGDLYWLNINRRGELWINTKEKPRPVFRAVKGTRVEGPPEEAKPEPRQEAGDGRPETGETPAERATFAPAEGDRREPKIETPAAPLALAGPELLAKIKPQMRRNRRGPGGSGSTSFLARALRCNEADLIAAFAALGLNLSPNPNDKPVYVEIAGDVWWLNQDSRGGVWINGREKKEGEVLNAPAPFEPKPEPGDGKQETETKPAEPLAAEPVENRESKIENSATSGPLAELRLMLKETRTGAVAGKLERLAEAAGQTPEQVLATLTAAGLVVPEKSKDKPVFVEHAGEIFWFNKNAKGELWLNAKASKFADKKDGGDEGEGAGAKSKLHRGGRSRSKKSE